MEVVQRLVYVITTGHYIFPTGRRNYSRLSLESKTNYLTSSFWRFLAENFGGVKVFPHFLDEPLAKSASNKDLPQMVG